MKKREEFIDTAKFLGMVMLLMDHTGYRLGIDDTFLKTKMWICSVHMPLFFIIYGVVASRRQIVEKKEVYWFILKKFKALIVPYILWSVIYAKEFNLKFIIGVLYGSNMALGEIAHTNSVLWFLPVMFLSTCIYQLTIQIENKVFFGKKMLIAIEIILLSIGAYIGKILGDLLRYRVLWGADIALIGTVFMIIGHYFVMPVLDMINVTGKTKYKKLIMTLMVFLSGIYMALYNGMCGRETYVLPCMALGVYGRNIIIFILCAVINSIVILKISYIISNKYFAWFGKASMRIREA